jgi:hypothetical protein
MKSPRTLACLTILAAAVPLASVQARPPHRNGHWKGGGNGEEAAMREEALLDKRDTHGPLGVWEKERRPADLERYHSITFARIRGLLANGSLTEENGTTFKKRHEEITALLTAKRAEGLTDASRAEVRGQLDELNDDINTVVKKAEAGDLRTPVLNQKQHLIEERIEFGERSGRLSKGEAATLRRKLERLQDLEERLKDGQLSTREREKLHKEANEVIADLHRELKEG